MLATRCWRHERRVTDADTVDARVRELCTTTQARALAREQEQCDNEQRFAVPSSL